MKSIRISIILAALSAIAFCSCDKWTRPENLSYVKTPHDQQDPAAWEEYLSSLRSFKQSGHTLMFLTMKGTSEYPSRQSQHLMAVPDSVDIICVDKCENLHQAVVDEIAEVEARKGTKVVSNVDLAVAYADWLDYKVAQMDNGRTEAEVDKDAPDFFTRHAEKQLAYCDQFGFKGIQLSLYVEAGLTADERLNCMNPFADAAEKWKKAHASHLFIVKESLNNIADASIIADADYLVVRLGGNKGAASYRTILRNTFRNLSDEAKGKIVFETVVPNSEDTNPLVDLPYDVVENILGKDSWGSTYDVYRLLGVAVSNGQDDYYNENYFTKEDTERQNPVSFGSFVNVRRAIALANNK